MKRRTPGRARGRTVLEEDRPSLKKADAPSATLRTSAAASPWGTTATQLPKPGSKWSAQATKASSTTKTTANATPAWGASQAAAKTGAWHQQTQSRGRQGHTAVNHGWGDGEETESESESDWEGGGHDGGWGATGTGASAWTQQPKTQVASTSAIPAARTSGWRSWGEEAKRNSKASNSAAGATDSRNVLLPQQRSQILDSLLNVPQSQNNYVSQHKQAQKAQKAAQQNVNHFPQFSHIANPSQSKNQPTQNGWWTQQTVKQEAKATKEDKQKGSHRRAQSEDPWGAGGTGGWHTRASAEPYGWGPIPEEDEEDYEDARRVHFSPKPTSQMWGEGNKSPLWGGGKPGKAESVNGWGAGKHDFGDDDDDDDDDGWGTTKEDVGWGTSKEEFSSGWGGKGGLTDATNGWGGNPTQGNNPWSAWADDKASPSTSPWGTSMKDGAGHWGLLERPKGKAPSISSARPHDKQSEASYSMPSRTFAHAYHGTTIPLDSSRFTTNSILSDYTDVQIQGSGMQALQPAQKALFGKGRRARERIHWMFPPDKDERVRSLLAWIQNASTSLGTYGVHKFIQSRERGALFANADFRLPGDVPAFDWLTFDELQRTKDKTLQESVLSYDPTDRVILFVFLPSPTGNSVAMWRRKITVPNNTRLSLQAHIEQALAGLRRDSDYIVHVDEMIGEMPLVTRSMSLPTALPSSGLKPKKKKRRWWKVLFGRA
ncbi:hypothetical protein V5O48_000016 [Marasmius crinis-equi]|uniref:CcmS related domain-containing protein n=1 Tax=Marasmius crinis-equi TaxID=585013 RepID=A0ABR3G2P2_9AGAR